MKYLDEQLLCTFSSLPEITGIVPYSVNINGTYVFNGNCYITDYQNVKIDITEIVKNYRYKADTSKYLDESIDSDSSIISGLIGTAYAKISYGGTNYTSNTIQVAFAYRYPHRISSMETALYPLGTSNNFHFMLQGSKSNGELILKPHIPFIKTDKFFYNITSYNGNKTNMTIVPSGKIFGSAITQSITPHRNQESHFKLSYLLDDATIPQGYIEQEVMGTMACPFATYGGGFEKDKNSFYITERASIRLYVCLVDGTPSSYYPIQIFNTPVFEPGTVHHYEFPFNANRDLDYIIFKIGDTDHFVIKLGSLFRETSDINRFVLSFDTEVVSDSTFGLDFYYIKNISILNHSAFIVNTYSNILGLGKEWTLARYSGSPVISSDGTEVSMAYESGDDLQGSAIISGTKYSTGMNVRLTEQWFSMGFNVSELTRGSLQMQSGDNIFSADSNTLYSTDFYVVEYKVETNGSNAVHCVCDARRSSYTHIPLSYGDNGYLKINNIDNVEVDICPTKYYLEWEDRYGGWQSQGFDGACSYEESLSRTNTTNYYGVQKNINVTASPKYKINSGWIPKELFPYYESVLVSNNIYLYDVENDFTYKVLCTNNSYVEKTFDNEKKFFNISFNFDLDKEETIIY